MLYIIKLKALVTVVLFNAAYVSVRTLKEVAVRSNAFIYLSSLASSDSGVSDSI